MKFNENTSLRISARLRNGSVPVAPGTLHYKVTNITTDATVIDWTPITAAADVVVDLDARLLSVRNRYEDFHIAIVADKDTANAVTVGKEFRLMKVTGLD